jgi:hypothetical protein
MIGVNGMMTNLRTNAQTDPDGILFRTRLQLAGMVATEGHAVILGHAIQEGEK